MTTLRCSDSPTNPGLEDLNSTLGSLHRYSFTYWPYHYKRSGLNDTTSELYHQMIEFMYDEDGDVSLFFKAWLDMTKEISRALERGHPQKLAMDAIGSVDPTPLFTSCAFGLNDLLDYIAARFLPRWEQKNSHGQTGLYLAAAMGHTEIAKKLIQQGADCNVECERRGFPMAAACFNGHMKIVELLVGAGASLNPTTTYPNALEAAMNGGHEDIAIYLLETVCQPLDQNMYDTAVLRASQGGYLKIFTWLQKPDVLVKYGKRAPSTMAARNKMIRGGHVAMLRKSMAKSIDPLSALPADGISTAALHGQIAMVNFLLDSGMDVEHEGQFGTPLRTACLMNHIHIAYTLLKRGADIDRSGTMGNALQAAAMRGHTQLVQILIDEGAEVGSGGGMLGNALQAAAYYGHKQVVERLLNAGADAYQLGFTRDAFHAAAEGDHEDVVNYLRQKNYYPHYPQCLAKSIPKVEPPLKENMSRLIADAREPSFETIHRLVLEPGPMISEKSRKFISEIYRNQTRSQKPHPLMSGVWSGSASVVKILLQDPRVGKRGCVNAFVQAARGGLTEIVQLFLREVEASSLDIGKALESAASSGCLEIVKILLDFEGPEMSRNDHIKCLLASGHPTMVQYGLLIGPADCSIEDLAHFRKHALETIAARKAQSDDAIQVIDNLICTKPSLDLEPDLESCLRLSAAQGHLDVVAHLIHQHLWKARFTIFEIPFLLAAGNGHLEIVQILYERIQEKELGLFYSQALAVSSEAGYASVVEFLIQTRADVNALIPEVPVLCRKMAPCCFSGGNTVTDYAVDCKDVLELGLNCIYNKTVETPTSISVLQACLRGFEQPDDDCRPFFKHRWAASEGAQHERVLEVLLHHGANPNHLGGRKELPIVYAATHYTLDILKLLIDKGACVNAMNNNASILHAAITRQNSVQAVFDLLSEFGAIAPAKKPPGTIDPVLDQVLDGIDHIEAQRRFGTHTKDVFQGGLGSILRNLLIQHPEEKAHDDRYTQVLIMAAQHNEYSIVKLLLERDVDVNATVYHHGTALKTASLYGHVDIVRFLLKAGANVNTISGEHGTALRAAITKGHSDTVKLLLSWKADPHLKEDRSQNHIIGEHFPSALQLAVQSRCLASVELLIDAGADVKEIVEGYTHPLYEACWRGNYQMVMALLQAGAPVDPPSSLSAHAAPLKEACRNGHLDIVQCLIDHGARIDSGREHPVVFAARSGQLHVVQYFLARPDIDLSVLEEALHYVSFKGHSAVMSELDLRVEFPDVWGLS